MANIRARRTISLAMIVRDEERCLRRALDSVRALVDEIVVVDTGSTDSTVAIARNVGAQVHHLDWSDDFAAARNHALERCTGDWRVVLDADEWLVGGSWYVLALREQAPTFVGAIEVMSSFEDSSGPAAVMRATPALLPRVLPRGVTYQGRVHEQPVHTLPVRRLGVRFDHDGYTPGPMATKADRNLRLLMAELADHPQDAYLHYQLGKDHEVHHRFEQACTAYALARELGSSDDAFRQDLVVRSMYVLKRAGRTPQAIALAQDEMPRFERSADFHFCLGDVLLDHALTVPEQAATLVPMIEDSWLRCLELGDGDAATGAVPGRGSHLAAANLVALYETTGRDERARALRAALAV